MRKFLPNARSPYFVQLAALRAEKLYGVAAEEAARRILRGKKRAEQPHRQRGLSEEEELPIAG